MVVIVVVGLLFLWPTYTRGQSLRRQAAELDAKIAAKQREIDRLVDNRRRFRSDRDFVEHIARQNGRVFPGELVFIYEDAKE